MRMRKTPSFLSSLSLYLLRTVPQVRDPLFASAPSFSITPGDSLSLYSLILIFLLHNNIH